MRSAKLPHRNSHPPISLLPLLTTTRTFSDLNPGSSEREGERKREKEKWRKGIT